MTTMYFDTSAARYDNTRRARHGLLWSKDDIAMLEKLWHQGCELKPMAVALERPCDGVLSKLSQRGLIAFDTRTMKYEMRCVPNALRARDEAPARIHESNEPKEELTMTANIETKTFIQGEDAANLSDGQIFDKIAKIEAKIDSLNKIVTKPKKLEKVIADLHGDIEKLVVFVDSRP